MELLNLIQQQLKVPKGQFNSFGKYSYRNAEDILEAVKPLLGERGTLTLSDEIVAVGGRVYVMATATLTDEQKNIFKTGESGSGDLVPLIPSERVSITAYAREALDKKGMDEAQITGAASSYARKYALNGLFCIDDTKDADHEVEEKPAPKKVAEDAGPFEGILRGTSNLQELKAAWADVPPERKAELEAVKEELKAKFTNNE